MSAFGVISADTLAITVDLDRSNMGRTPEIVQQPLRAVYIENQELLYPKILEQLPNSDSRLLFVAYISTLFHETRHSHDLMSSMHGVTWIQNICRFALNYAAVLIKVADCVKSNHLTEVRLPLTQDVLAFDPLVQRLHGDYQRFKAKRATFRRPGGIFDPNLTHGNLLEASAFMIQLDAIDTLFGEEQTAAFLAWTRDTPERALYLGSLEAAVDRIRKPVFDEFRASGVLALIVWSALQGATPDPAPRGHFIDLLTYFEALLEFLTRRRAVPTLEKALGLVEDFRRSWGLTTLAAQVRWACNDVEAYSAKLAKEASARQYHGPAIDVLNATARAFAQFSSQILEAPELYFPGAAYCAHWHTFPGVPRYVVAQAEVHMASVPHAFVDLDTWDMFTMAESIVRLLFDGIGFCSHSIHDRRAIELIEETVGVQVVDGLLF